MTVVFLSNSVDSPWTSHLAVALEKRGVESDLWVLDERQRQRDARLPGFRRVVNIAAPVSGRPSLADLRRVEAAYGKPLLHQAALSDRVLTARNLGVPSVWPQRRWTNDAVLGLADSLTRNATSYFEHTRPVALVTEVADFASQWMCGVGRAFGIRVLGPFMESYLPKRIRFLEHGSAEWPEAIALMDPERPVSAEASAYAAAALDRLRAVDYAHIASAVGRSWRRASVRTALHDWKQGRSYGRTGSPHAMHPYLVSPLVRLERYTRTRMGRRLYDTLALRDLPTGSFVVYFLHVQPEVTVEHQAFRHLDQLATVRNIASALPSDISLVVKEHGATGGNRDVVFYEELASMPTVSVLHHSFDTRRLIQQAKAVLTLTGTVALEAICNETPVLVLGETYYRRLPGAFGIDSYESISQLVEHCDELPRATPDECLRMLAARYDASVPGMWPGCSFDEMWDESEGSEVTARSLMDVLGGLTDSAVHPRGDQHVVQPRQ